MLPERFYIGDAEVLVGADVDETVRIAAGQFAAIARKLSSEDRMMHVALSGGSTPRRLFQSLASEPFVGIVPWRSICFFWGDERNVPPNHHDSNFGVARELLLSLVPVPPSNVYRIPAGDGTAIEAAEFYERTLRQKVPIMNGFPRLDFVMLGLGANGHTASLFPHRPTLHERERFVVADHVEEVHAWRVTLTTPVFNNAAQVTFLVTGEDKAPVVEQVIAGPRDADSVPAQLIAPIDGRLTWILDTAAASQLNRPATAQQRANG
jgi:6-phosphogluconolactonase